MGACSVPIFTIMNQKLITRIKYYKQLGFSLRHICKLTGCTYRNALKYTYGIKPKDNCNTKDDLEVIHANNRLKLRNSSS